MGHLLSSAIKMQSSAPATGTLKYELATNGFIGGTMKMYINGALYQTMVSDTSTVTVTLNEGDTFYGTIQEPFGSGCSIDYTLNGTYVTGWSTGGTGLVTTTTYTVSAGNTYWFFGNFGLV